MKRIHSDFGRDDKNKNDSQGVKIKNKTKQNKLLQIRIKFISSFYILLNSVLYTMITNFVSKFRICGICQGANVDTRSRYKMGWKAITHKNSRAPSIVPLLGTPQALGNKPIPYSREGYCLGGGMMSPGAWATIQRIQIPAKTLAFL